MTLRRAAGITVMTWALVVVVFAAVSDVNAQERRKVNFRFSWTVYGAYAPYWLALDRGYFAEEGLDVSFSEVIGSGNLVKLMAAGSDPFGDPDFGTMIKGIAKGMEIKAVYGVFQKTTLGIVSRAEKPIRTPQDLVGRMIGMGKEESSAQIFPAILAANKVDVDKITIVHPAAGAKLGLFLNSNVDGITAAANLQPPVIEAKGIKTVFMNYGDVGANTLNNGVAAEAKWLEKNGDTVRRFLRGLTRGLKAAQADPEAAVQALVNHYSDQKEQRAVFMAQLMNTLPLLQTQNSKGQPLGWMAKADWEQTQDILLKYGGLEKRAPVETYYTNEYVPR